MKRIAILITTGMMLMIAGSCEFLEPKPMGWLDEEDVLNHHDWTPGILNQIYYNMYEEFIHGNAQGWTDHLGISLDYTTDNAVANNRISRIAGGGWTAENDLHDTWTFAYSNIRIINYFLEKGLDTWYARDSLRNAELKKRYLGEAYFLRAWMQWILLRDYAGPADASGQEMLGFPIVTDIPATEDLNLLPRNTYSECVQQIVDDCDSAFARLPVLYNTQDAVTGLINNGRASGAAALSLKSRVYLFAASPAFNKEQDIKLWERAAQAAYDAIEATGGLTKLNPFGEFNNTDNSDHIWRSEFLITNAIENAHFPPSLFGNGECNPSQNLVDAFPMITGWPISESISGYDSISPYRNRDKRFYSFIWHNGINKLGTEDIEIATFEGGRDADGGARQYGTRTGYYMKKFTSNINIDPGETTVQSSTEKFVVFIRKAELYLNFAESANHAYGNPSANAPGFSFSAAEALKRVRERGGIYPGTDFYTDMMAADPVTFDEHVQIERRIEFCFEGFRFYDIRRLLLDMNKEVSGVRIVRQDSANFLHSFKVVEERNFEPHMIYGPIPYEEILKNSNLVQNYGWE